MYIAGISFEERTITFDEKNKCKHTNFEMS